MNTVSIEIQLKTIPETPGVYQFLDSKDRVIYVGKAKNLNSIFKVLFADEM